MKSNLIAPCGMNCMICKGYLREKNKCPGCRFIDIKKLKTRNKCIIRNCNELKNNGLKFCSIKCKKFPCQRLKNLDKRYKTKYNMSMINNLNTINIKGLREFLKQQKNKYQKPNGVLCVHDNQYYEL
jgi:hypothetical protein